MDKVISWTKRARVVFAALARGGKLSLRDLLAGGHLEGKSAQSSLVQSIARWARKGLVEIDAGAPKNYPRYTLTAAGRQVWDEAVAVAQANARKFLETLASDLFKRTMPPPAMPSLPTVANEVWVVCPRCYTKNALNDLDRMRQQSKVPACEECSLDLTSEIAELEKSRTE
ncbi:MAG TPA: hypothetical protein VKK79_12440 [Candidatus Lokiarchaeia archaeon]|nr:hypothetical protein [Candidatus Lokiarchaeia archaeon]